MQKSTDFAMESNIYCPTWFGPINDLLFETMTIDVESD